MYLSIFIFFLKWSREDSYVVFVDKVAHILAVVRGSNPSSVELFIN